MSTIYLKDKSIAERLGVARQTVWRFVKTDPYFPKPIHLSGGCTRWMLHEIEAWEQLRKTASTRKK